MARENRTWGDNRMKELFLRLVISQAEKLPDKLGNLLRSLA